MTNDKHLVVAIYSHPEGYPPTLNAITALSSCFNTIDVIHRPHVKGTWAYPSNVTAIAAGQYITSRAQEQAPVWKKIVFFVGFVKAFYNSCRKKKPSWILVYDPLALLAYRVLRPFLFFQHKVWYHNHDIAEPGQTRKFSLGWFAVKGEKKLFNKLDLFSLPTDERLPWFEMKAWKGKYFCIPNYPSLSFYRPFYQPGKNISNEIRIIFQGRIGDHHGIEEIVGMLAEKINGATIRLVLKGNYDQDYRDKIDRLAAEKQVGDSIEWHGFSPYKEVPLLASTCHIGIAIFAKQDIMNVTLGTASNKIYEYAAVGLPVLYLEQSGIQKHLEKYAWAFPVTLTPASIRTGVQSISADYARYSLEAFASFESALNFEQYFEPVKKYIQSTLV